LTCKGKRPAEVSKNIGDIFEIQIGLGREVIDTIGGLVHKLGNKSRRVRQKAERELVEIGEPVVEPLINDRMWPEYDID